MAHKPSKISDAVTALWDKNHKQLQTILGQGIANALTAHKPTLQKLTHTEVKSQDDGKRAVQAMMKRQKRMARNRKQLEKQNGD